MAAYKGNIGMIEMVKFAMEATQQQQYEMDAIVENDDWEEYKNLIDEVLSVELV